VSDSFEDISNKFPDFNAVLHQRIISKNTLSDPNIKSEKWIDPYQLMLKKKSGEPITTEIDPSTIQKWPEEDVKKLTDYCQRQGIFGFNCGRMHPLAALAMLKKQVGDYSDVPLEERIPSGYERRGTPGLGPNYPYTEAMRKKQILHG